MNIKVYETTKINAPYELLLLADPSVELIKRYLEVSRCYVATIDDQVVGTYLLRLNSPNEMELLNIAVAPAHHRSGVGTLLLESAIANSRASNAKKIVLGTGTFGYQLSFYQKQGFRVESIIKDFFLDNYDEVIIEDGIQHRDMLRLYLDL